MARGTNDPRKETLLISAILGVMTGIVAYAIYKSLTGGDVALVSILLPVGLVAALLVRRLVVMRRGGETAAE